MNTIKNFMDSYLLAKVKVEQQNQQMNERWIEPIALGLQAVLANQMRGKDGVNIQQQQERKLR